MTEVNPAIGWSHDVIPATKPVNGKVDDSVALVMRGGSSTSKDPLPPGFDIYIPGTSLRIDFVLAYDSTKEEEDDNEEQAKRTTFENNLRKAGLILHHTEPQNSQDSATVYVLLHAPFAVLARNAELLNIKMPIQYENHPLEGVERFWSSLFAVFDYDHAEIPDEEDFFSAPFTMHNVELFRVNEKNEDEFFEYGERNRIAYYVLQSTKYAEDDAQGAKFVDTPGIHKLVNKGVYKGAYPLHDGPYKLDKKPDAESGEVAEEFAKKNQRRLLYEHWVGFKSNWYKYQPLDLIKKYFGVKFSIYYAWLGYYTHMLIPASIAGIICFIYGLATLWDNAPSNEICDDNLMGATIMCPNCVKNCNYIQLSSSCMYARLTYVFDNYGTLVFSIVMSLWAIFFLELWRRRQYELQYDWDVASFEEEEVVRPEYEARVKRTRVNPVTQEKEPWMPSWDKCWRITVSLVSVLFMICVVMAAVIGVIVYRIMIIGIFYKIQDQYVSKYAKSVTSMTAACINLIVIMLLGKVYEKLAWFLTNLEQSRTQTEFEDSFTLKMYIFQFVNYYASIFYIAFFKGRLYRKLPNDTNRSSNNECDASGCMQELVIQVAFIMVGKQVLNNIMELGVPYLMTWWKTRKSVRQEDAYQSWERDFDLVEIPPTGLFNEYLELVIQFGFITIFVAAFPLAPFFALINNVVEIRLDAFKHLTQWRRPVAYRAQDIGIWYTILNSVIRVAVLCNAFILAFTSDTLPKIYYQMTRSDKGRETQGLSGFVDFTLSTFNISDLGDNGPAADRPDFMDANVTMCRYRDFRNPPGTPDAYKYSAEYFEITCARLGFVIAFVVVVNFLAWVVTIITPEKPERVKLLELRERFLVKKAIIAQNAKKDA